MNKQRTLDRIGELGLLAVDNVREWFAVGAFAVDAGGQLRPADWAAEGRFDDIPERARAFVKEVQEARSAQ